MRILHVNKFLYRRGGAETYMLDLAQVQSSSGDVVEFFAMEHPDNEQASFEEYFPRHVSFAMSDQGTVDKIRGMGRMLYSTAARKGMELTISKFRPDVAHLHNIYHQLSPSILGPLNRRGIPIVMTLHDYKLACPTYRFLAGESICEACIGGRFSNAMIKRCNNGSLLASTMSSVESTLHRASRAYAPIHLFLCPSEFIQHKMIEAGVFPEKLRVIPNPVDLRRFRPSSSRGGNHILYFGRLSKEKGVDTLIEAARSVNTPLVIVGDGPERQTLAQLCIDYGVNAKFAGRVDPAGITQFLAGAIVTVLPARWYENQPLSILESFASGVPVVGSNLGGIPELIKESRTGFLVPPDDPVALARALNSVIANPKATREMGLRARSLMEEKFSLAAHRVRLQGLYGEARELASGQVS